jgi:hypothetical protein
VGGLASLIALSLFFPRFIPSGVRVNPRYDTSFFVQPHQDLVKDL